MTDMLPLLLSLGAGFATGLFFFGGLYLTVRQVTKARRPGVALIASFIVRTAIALLAFYWIMGTSWQRLLAAVAGFVAARLLLVHWIKPRPVSAGDT